MRIRFETTMNDLVAFHHFHYANSPTWRRQIWTVTIAIPICLFVMFAIFRIMLMDRTRGGPAVEFDRFFAIHWFDCVGIAAILPSSAAWYFYARWSLTRNLERRVRNLLAEGSNHTILGWRELELIRDRLVVKTELMEASYDLRAIEKIVSDDKYTYVYISSIQAFMIPMTLYPEEEYREFVAELLDAWENREAPRPAIRPADERIVEGPV